MRKLIAPLPAAAVIAVGVVVVLQTSASASTTTFVPPGSPARHVAAARTTTSQAATQSSVDTPAGRSPAGVSLTTTMISYKPIDASPGRLSPGDGYVLAGRVSQHGRAEGLSTAQCTYTSTRGLVLRLCTVDYALAGGLIMTSGYVRGPVTGAPVTLVVDGGTGAYQNERGYGTLHPTSTGSNVVLYLTR